MINNETVSLLAVESICNDIGILAQTIEAACMSGLHSRSENPNFNEHQNLWMIRNAVQTIGVLADHAIGGDMRGTEAWLDLPDMERSEAVS